jgi:large subunit ribosomal protein L23
VLLGPDVTEKAARLAESGTYVFAVAPHAGKIDVARAVQELYDVHPTKVAVLNSQRKPKVFAQRYGRRAAKRKAYVTLTPGESIELFKQ